MAFLQHRVRGECILWISYVIVVLFMFYVFGVGFGTPLVEVVILILTLMACLVQNLAH